MKLLNRNRGLAHDRFGGVPRAPAVYSALSGRVRHCNRQLYANVGSSKLLEGSRGRANCQLRSEDQPRRLPKGDGDFLSLPLPYIHPHLFSQTPPNRGFGLSVIDSPPTGAAWRVGGDALRSPRLLSRESSAFPKVYCVWLIRSHAGWEVLLFSPARRVLPTRRSKHAGRTFRRTGRIFPPPPSREPPLQKTEGFRVDRFDPMPLCLSLPERAGVHHRRQGMKSRYTTSEGRGTSCFAGLIMASWRGGGGAQVSQAAYSQQSLLPVAKALDLPFSERQTGATRRFPVPPSRKSDACHVDGGPGRTAACDGHGDRRGPFSSNSTYSRMVLRLKWSCRLRENIT